VSTFHRNSVCDIVGSCSWTAERFS